MLAQNQEQGRASFNKLPQKLRTSHRYIGEGNKISITLFSASGCVWDLIDSRPKPLLQKKQIGSIMSLLDYTITKKQSAYFADLSDLLTDLKEIRCVISNECSKKLLSYSATY